MRGLFVFTGILGLDPHNTLTDTQVKGIKRGDEKSSFEK